MFEIVLGAMLLRPLERFCATILVFMVLPHATLSKRLQTLWRRLSLHMVFLLDTVTPPDTVALPSQSVSPVLLRMGGSTGYRASERVAIRVCPEGTCLGLDI